jgi:hypothetical protein
MFGGLLVNTPEAPLQGTMTKRGRIEYQYRVYGGVTVLFIEVKLELGNDMELLNFIAQVIAECDGTVSLYSKSRSCMTNIHSTACSFMNYRNKYSLPIIGILCDGRSFYFFEFVGRYDGEKPRFSFGQFSDGAKGVNILQSQSRFLQAEFEFDCRSAVKLVRSACDALYFVFLKGYKTGLEAYWNRSIERGKAEGKERTSTPGWHNAMVAAGKALDEAVSAWDKHNKGDREAAIQSADRALSLLTERYNYCLPPSP